MTRRRRRESEADAPDDSELLQRIAAQRDAEAWGELVSRHGGAVFALALTITRDHADAADAVQDTFLIVRKSAASFRYGRNARSWLFKIVSREALRIATRAKREHRRTEHAMEDAVATETADPSPADSVEQHELLGALRQAVEDLPLVLRSTVALRFFAGMTQAQIADELGCERSTVSTRISQALGRLRQRLGPAHGAQLGALLPALFEGSGAGGLPATLHQSLNVIGSARSSKLLLATQQAAPSSSAPLAKTAIAIGAVLAAGITAALMLDAPQPTAAPTPDPAPVVAPAAPAPAPEPARWFWSFDHGLPEAWQIADPAGTLSWSADAEGEGGVLAAGDELALAVLPVDLDTPFVVRYRWYPRAGWDQTITIDHPSGPDGFPARRNWQLPLARPGARTWAEYEHYHRDGWMVSRLRIGDRQDATVSRVSRYQLPADRTQLRQSLILSRVLLTELEIRELDDAAFEAAVGDPAQLAGSARAKPQDYAAGPGAYAHLFELVDRSASQEADDVP